jgi:integrase
MLFTANHLYARSLRAKSETKMPVAHLTDIVVSRLKSPGTYFDETTPAFGVRVGKSRKTWIVMRGIERQRVRIGHYPALSLADARKEAKKLLTEEPTRHSNMRFAAAYEEFKEAIKAKKPRTQRDYKRVIDKYLLPKLGKKKLPALEYEDFTEITDNLARSEKSHTLAVARTFLRWCVRPPRRYISHSPLEGVKVEPGKGRKRILKSDELKKVWDAAERVGYPYGTVVQLLILNGQRKGETSNLRWPWINEKERLITLPDWITKNGKQHTFPYGDMTAAIFETIPRRNSTDLLFPSYVSDERPISGWSKYKKNLGDGVSGWTLHDLRRTFATMLAEMKVPPHVVEKLLNHTMGSIGNKADSIVSAVAEVYNLAKYLPEMRDAVEKSWEPYLQNLTRAA